MLAASIYSEDESGALVTNTEAIDRFGYSLEDFPDAPVAPYAAPAEPDADPVETPETTPISEWADRVPKGILAWQAKAVLTMRGLLAAAEAVIDTLPDEQRIVLRSAWDNNAMFPRNSVIIVTLAADLGLAESDLDEMFVTASKLTF